MSKFKEYKNYIPLEKMTARDNNPEWLIVHHTSGGGFPSFESVQHFHITDPAYRFENIGYHYFIEKDGTLKHGRPEGYHGAHTKEQKMNFKSVGICLSGDFDKFDPTSEQVWALSSLLGNLSKKYNIPKERIVPHRHFAKYKSCYGNRLPDDWARNLLDDKCICLKDATPTQILNELISRIK